MTRLMGDATHDNVPVLATVPGLDIVQGYVTGTVDVVWTAADWARFSHLTTVTNDQGGPGSPVPSAVIRDVEPGAWSPAAAVNDLPWTAVRPTIYCDQNDLTRTGGVLDSGWHGDLWIAIPGWNLGDPLPPTPGCTIVAVQNVFTGAYDLSVVLDDTWPAPRKRADMPLAIAATGVTEVYLLDGGRMSHITDIQSLAQLEAAGVPKVTVTAAALTQFLTDYPPGNPPVTVTVTG